MWRDLTLQLGGHSTTRPFLFVYLADRLTTAGRLARTVGSLHEMASPMGFYLCHVSLGSENFGQYWLAPLHFPHDIQAEIAAWAASTASVDSLVTRQLSAPVHRRITW